MNSWYNVVHLIIICASANGGPISGTTAGLEVN